MWSLLATLELIYDDSYVSTWLAEVVGVALAYA